MLLAALNPNWCSDKMFSASKQVASFFPVILSHNLRNAVHSAIGLLFCSFIGIPSLLIIATLILFHVAGKCLSLWIALNSAVMVAIQQSGRLINRSSGIMSTPAALPFFVLSIPSLTFSSVV